MKNLFLFILFLIANNISGQIGLILTEKLDEAKDRKLLVELKSEDPNDFADIDNPESKEHLLLFNKSYNASIQEELAKRWVLTTGEIVFKNTHEINQISEENLKKNYVFLQSGWSEQLNEIQGDFLMYSFDVTFFDSEGEKSTIFSLTYTPDDLISNADIIFFTKVLNNHIKISRELKKYGDYFDIEKNIDFVSKKTVLLDKNLTKLTTEEASQEYPHKIYVVNPERVAQEIENESDEYVFIRLIWSYHRNLAMYDAFDTKDCNIVSCIGTGGVRVNVGVKTRKYYGAGGTSNFYDANKYQYLNPDAGEYLFKVNIIRSNILIKGAHLNTMLQGWGQKLNCKLNLKSQ